MRKSTSLSRRRFGAILSATAAAVPVVVAQQNVQQLPGTPPAPGNFRRPLAPDTPAFEGKIEFRRKDVAARAEAFPMGQVRLLPGSVYHDAQEWNSGYV